MKSLSFVWSFSWLHHAIFFYVFVVSLSPFIISLGFSLQESLLWFMCCLPLSLSECLLFILLRCFFSFYIVEKSTSKLKKVLLYFILCFWTNLEVFWVDKLFYWSFNDVYYVFLGENKFLGLKNPQHYFPATSLVTRIWIN